MQDLKERFIINDPKLKEEFDTLLESKSENFQTVSDLLEYNWQIELFYGDKMKYSAYFIYNNVRFMDNSLGNDLEKVLHYLISGFRQCLVDNPNLLKNT